MPTYTHSSLSTYENCPLQYKFAYVDKIESEIETIESFMGRRVHEALEKLYRDLRLSKENTLEDLLSFYHDNWEKQWTENIKVVRREYSPENYRDTGAKCIANYYNRYKPFDDSKTLGLEQVIFVKIQDYTIKGLIDRLSHTQEGYYEIHDYKTSQYLPPKKYLDKEKQLAIYQMGVEKLWDDCISVDLVWHYLVQDKEIRCVRSKEEIDKLRRDILKLITEIEKATEEMNFPPKESPLCDWCEYQMLCPRKKHIVRTMEMPKNKYLADPGVKLVNEYSSLIEKRREVIREIDSELAKIKEAMIVFSKREKIDVIRGSDKKISVIEVVKSKFPTKKEKARKPLESLIKKSGKWMEVSDINMHKLERALEKWEPKLVREIKKYQTLDRRVKFVLSPIKDFED